ncbi:VOC family protein [Paenibacillus piri]|uniref:Extradiol dioxygenase n=1 Tax=Paenibacillus piri TaxID=2547395 RepID=A0A4R5KI98_9BACL|nr:VOC family protein [Paenibacillus piri]TDF94812.1 extradiol dioxygenase [Paenibacillus piri]
MLKKAWIDLPAKDPEKSVQFFKQLGFSEEPQYGTCVSVGELFVMLSVDSEFRQNAMNDVADPKQGTEVMITVEVASKDEVDDLVIKAGQAGGAIYREPQHLQGSMYWACFTDLDGHRWNVLYLGGYE